MEKQLKMLKLRADGFYELRITRRKEVVRGKKIVGERIRIKCGGCKEGGLDIYPGYNFLDINGVEASLNNWREVLLPLLKYEMRDGELVDVSPRAIAARDELKLLRKKYKKI